MLSEVELTSGTWTDVFRHLLCPFLSFFVAAKVGYAEHGESSHRKAWDYQPTEDFRNIFTNDGEEDDLYCDLIDKLMNKADGHQDYPDDLELHFFTRRS